MDRQSGFTLMELLITIAVFGILATIGLLQLSSYSKKSAMERQTAEMRADLSTARSQALFNKRACVATVAPGVFCIYSSTLTSVQPALRRTLASPVSMSVASGEPPVSTSTTALQIIFDTSGMAQFNGDSTLDTAAICQGNGGFLDSVLVSKSMTNSGKNNGSGCSSANIVAQ